MCRLIKLPFKVCVRPSKTPTLVHLLVMVVATGCIFSAHAQNIQTSSNATQVQDALTLQFADFYRNPVGPKGLEPTDKLQNANGKMVQIVGYLVQQEIPVPGRFMLAARPVQMSEHADGEADDLPPATVMVYLDVQHNDWVVPHIRGLVSLQGMLNVGRAQTADGRVTWLQLQLGPDATRTMNLAEQANFKHALQHRH